MPIDAPISAAGSLRSARTTSAGESSPSDQPPDPLPPDPVSATGVAGATGVPLGLGPPLLSGMCLLRSQAQRAYHRTAACSAIMRRRAASVYPTSRPAADSSRYSSPSRRLAFET